MRMRRDANKHPVLVNINADKIQYAATPNYSTNFDKVSYQTLPFNPTVSQVIESRSSGLQHLPIRSNKTQFHIFCPADSFIGGALGLGSDTSFQTQRRRPYVLHHVSDHELQL
jgi:hypothetical protein